MKKIIGYGLISLVFIAIFIALDNTYGFEKTAFAFLGAFIILGIIFFAVHLIYD